MITVPTSGTKVVCLSDMYKLIYLFIYVIIFDIFHKIKNK